MTTPSRLLSQNAVAEHYGCDRETVRKAILAGRFPARPVYGPGGKITSWVVATDDLGAWKPKRSGR